MVFCSLNVFFYFFNGSRERFFGDKCLEGGSTNLGELDPLSIESLSDVDCFLILLQKVFKIFKVRRLLLHLRQIIRFYGIIGQSLVKKLVGI